MKNIYEYVNEDYYSGWEYLDDCNDPTGTQLTGLINDEDAKWLFINTDSYQIMPVTEKNLKMWDDDMNEEDYLVSNCRKLKIGESFDADGGISIYIRIRK